MNGRKGMIMIMIEEDNRGQQGTHQGANSRRMPPARIMTCSWWFPPIFGMTTNRL